MTPKDMKDEIKQQIITDFQKTETPAKTYNTWILKIKQKHKVSKIQAVDYLNTILKHNQALIDPLKSKANT